MDVLNMLASHKQYLFDCIEPGYEIKSFDYFWDPASVQVLEPQAKAFSPAAMPCGNTLEALSRTGSPNGSLLNEAALKHDLLHHSHTKNLGAASTIRPLACHPYIKKCSKRGWTSSTNNAIRKELECSFGNALLDDIVYPNGSPFSMDHSLKMNLDYMYANNEGSMIFTDQLYENSSSTESYGDGKVSYLYGDSTSKQSLNSDFVCAHAKSPLQDSTSVSLASSENSTSVNASSSSEVLHPVLFDQNPMLDYAMPGIETLLDDAFLNAGALQGYDNDGSFISDPKKEQTMVNDDKGELIACGYNRSKAAHPQGFLVHTECQQGNDSMLVALNEGVEVPNHLRIDFEDNFVQLPNLTPDSSATSACYQFCLPKPLFGALQSNNTMQKLHVTDDGVTAQFAVCSDAAENKPFSKYTDGRHLSSMYSDTSMKSPNIYVSECSKPQQAPQSVKSEDRVVVGKMTEWGLGASNAFPHSDGRLKTNYSEFGLVRLLTEGAEAVARRDMGMATVILVRLKDMVSNLGNTLQRVVAYFVESLEHQIESTKRVDYARNIKSQGDILAAFQILHEIFPYIKFGHFTANQAILEAVQGANRVHIVDFEIMEGIQWPGLMQALLSRKGGPPELRITALCRPQWEHGLAMVQKTGKRLSEFASTLGLPFSFGLLKTEHDEVFNVKKLKLVEGEALIVNCMVHLPHMPRRSMESVTSFLHGMRELSPSIITFVEEELGCNTTAATSYFSEALYHFHAICDSLEACIPAEVEARMLVEKVFMAPRIDSAVAMWSRTTPVRSMHGMEVSAKHKWSTVMHFAGFKPMPLSLHSQSQAKLLLGLHRDGFCLEERSHYLVLGWQSRSLFAASVWK